MIGSFITRGLVMVFGYAYPAYECYKTVEMNKPDIEQLRFWCQYWILVAMLTVCERIGDLFISWVPMYSEAKLAFFLYLWFPKTKGTTYVYDSFFRPYVAKHETDIDRNLLELRTRAGDMAVLYWQKTASYGQTRIFEILQYIASQSTASRHAQPQQQGAGVRQHAVPPNQRSTAKTQPQNEQPPSPTSSTSSSHLQEDVAEEEGPSEASKAAPPPAVLNAQKTTPAQAQVESIKTLSSTEEQVMLIDSVPPTANETTQPPPQDMVMEEAGRVTRARSRRARGGSSR
ncbi:HVA22-like protein i [Forsythia ovata]|uniref:HVA22-like protein n=1 Tax=Forsythia ovata TaxID=205694 RepID=A0ABD1VLI8_9LAMI